MARLRSVAPHSRSNVSWSTDRVSLPANIRITSTILSTRSAASLPRTRPAATIAPAFTMGLYGRRSVLVEQDRVRRRRRSARRRHRSGLRHDRSRRAPVSRRTPWRWTATRTVRRGPPRRRLPIEVCEGDPERVSLPPCLAERVVAPLRVVEVGDCTVVRRQVTVVQLGQASVDPTTPNPLRPPSRPARAVRGWHAARRSRGKRVQLSEASALCTPVTTAWTGAQLVEQDIVGQHESLLSTEACDRSTLVALGRRGKSSRPFATSSDGTRSESGSRFA